MCAYIYIYLNIETELERKSNYDRWIDRKRLRGKNLSGEASYMDGYGVREK